MASKKRIDFKRCAVLNCTSNSRQNPNMGFAFVPQGPRRKVWLERMQSAFQTQKMYCCEHHFNVEKDCVNGGKKGCYLKLNQGVLPHRNMPENQVFALPMSDEYTDKKQSSALVVATSHETLTLEEVLMPGDATEMYSSIKETAGKEMVDPLNSTISLKQPVRDPCSDDDLEETIVSKVLLSTSFISTNDQPGTSGTSPWQQKDSGHQYASTDSSNDDLENKNPSKVLLSTSSTLADEQPGTSGTTPWQQKDIMQPSTITMESRSTATYHPSTAETRSTSSVSAMADIATPIRRTQLEFTLEAIRHYPKKFLGVPEASFHLIDIVSELTNINIRDIFIILRKLRLNEPHWQLAIQFQLSITSIGRIINENIALLADAMEGLIIWPELEDVQINLPSSFKHRFGAVNTIIDCFEIQIQKPTNSMHQALTYSTYKKCNSIKYLIACLPDGTINFISKGAGGRISDQEIVRQSGFLDKLCEHTMVMADRGFKSIELDLRSKNCTLIRPPSVTANTKMSREQVLTNKRIASLRIHVERAIGRLREFEMLKPHCTVESKVIKKLDYYVCIACGICNIQPNLIKE